MVLSRFISFIYDRNLVVRAIHAWFLVWIKKKENEKEKKQQNYSKWSWVSKPATKSTCTARWTMMVSTWESWTVWGAWYRVISWQKRRVRARASRHPACEGWVRARARDPALGDHPRRPGSRLAIAATKVSPCRPPDLLLLIVSPLSGDDSRGVRGRAMLGIWGCNTLPCAFHSRWVPSTSFYEVLLCIVFFLLLRKLVSTWSWKSFKLTLILVGHDKEV